MPTNGVTDLVHMSGECLCGSFAKAGEREELSFWFPEVAHRFNELESLVAQVPGIPEHRRTWGWGAHVREPTPDAPDLFHV